MKKLNLRMMKELTQQPNYRPRIPKEVRPQGLFIFYYSSFITISKEWMENSYTYPKGCIKVFQVVCGNR